MSDARHRRVRRHSVVTERGATARLAQAFKALVPEARTARVAGLAGRSRGCSPPLGRDTSSRTCGSGPRDAAVLPDENSCPPTTRASCRRRARWRWTSSSQRRPARTHRRVAGDDHGRRDSGPRSAAAAGPAAPRGRSRTVAGGRGAGRRARRRLVLLGDFASRGAAGAGACGCRPKGIPARRATAVAALGPAGRRPLMEQMVGQLPDDRRGVFEHSRPVSALGPRSSGRWPRPSAAEDSGRAFRRLKRRADGFGAGGRERSSSSRFPEPGRAPYGDRSAPRLWRRGRAPRTGGVAGRRGPPRAARGHPRDHHDRQRRGLRNARKAPDLGIGTVPRRDPAALGHLPRRARAAAVRAHRLQSHRTAGRRARSTVGPRSAGAMRRDAGRRGHSSKALLDGEWWAPFRTAAIRAAAARALRGSARQKPGGPQEAADWAAAACARPRASNWRAARHAPPRRRGGDPLIDHSRRVRLADELLRRFASALRGAQLYAAGHPLVGRNTDAFSNHRPAHRPAAVPDPRRGRRRVRRRRRAPSALERDDGGTDAEAPATGRRAHRHRPGRDARRNRDAGLGLSRRTTVDARARSTPWRCQPLPHVRVGRIQVEERVDTSVADTAAIRAAYNEASTIAETSVAAVDGRGHAPTRARRAAWSTRWRRPSRRTARRWSR